MEKVDLAEKLASFAEPWVPKVVAELNGQYVKVAHFEGEYVWHSHATEDEAFLVVDGGQLFVVPRGVEHKPVAHGRAQVVLFEPASTRNTGEVDHEYTIEPGDLQRI